MRKLTFLDGIVGLAFVVGFVIRILNLGALPLNDAEAKWAMQAFQLTSGGFAVGAQAGLVLWSSALFRVMEASNFLAKFFPAIVGSLIVFTPLFFRKALGNPATAILSFGLALDPLLVGVSRQVDGLSMAISLASLTAGFWFWRKSLPFGLCLGLFLMTGPSAWMGMLILIIFVLARRFLFKDRLSFTSMFDGEWKWGMALLGLGVSLFVGGTLMMQTPTGLSGMLNGLVGFLQGWNPGTVAQTQGAMAAIAVLNYLGLPLVFGFLRMVHGLQSRNSMDLILSALVLCVVLVLFIYPGFEIRQFAWLSPILWVLAARQIGEMPWKSWTGPTLIMLAITLAMLIFASINLSTLVNPIGDGANTGLRISAIGVALLVVALTGILVWWGWTKSEAGHGLSVGLLILLTGFSLTSSWRSAGLNGKINLELINQASVFKDSDLLNTTVNDLSEWTTGQRNFMDVVVLDVQSPAVDWLLRNTKNYQKTSSLIPGENPGIIITQSTSELVRTELYTGQEFTLRENPIWSGLTSRQWLGWLIRRELPVTQETIILWARSDLFPGAVTPTGNPGE